MSPTPAEQNFDRLPSLMRMYALGLIGTIRHHPDPTLPALSAAIAPLRPKLDELAHYRRLCGFAEGDTLPWTYPHVLATPLHVALVTHRRFPHPVLGMVHVRQHIVCHRPIANAACLAIHCHLGEQQAARRGVEFDTHTTVHSDGALAWQSIATALVRDGRKPPPRIKLAEPAVEWSEVRDLEVPADMGRRYAKVTGDFNPIHLYRWTARPFGFQAAIVHGMWTVARVLAAFGDRLPEPPVALTADFVRPLPLPQSIRLARRQVGDAMELVARSRDDKHTFVRVNVRRHLGEP